MVAILPDTCGSFFVFVVGIETEVGEEDVSDPGSSQSESEGASDEDERVISPGVESPGPREISRESPEPLQVSTAPEAEVTSTTSGTPPVPMETGSQQPRGGVELKASENSAFRRISLGFGSLGGLGSLGSMGALGERNGSVGDNPLHDIPSMSAFGSSYLAKSRQAYEEHMRLLNYPLIPPHSVGAPGGTPGDLPHTGPPRAHMHHPSLTPPSLTPREYDPLLMARYDLSYLHMAHAASMPRLDLLGYTDPRMPITNYYLTAARMRYEQHQQALLALARERERMNQRDEIPRPKTPSSPPAKERDEVPIAEHDVRRSPTIREQLKRSPKEADTASPPHSQSLSSSIPCDLRRKSANEHAELGSPTSTLSRSLPHSMTPHSPLSATHPAMHSLTPGVPHSMHPLSPPVEGRSPPEAHQHHRHPSLPGLSPEFPPRDPYGRTISPPSAFPLLTGID